MAISMNGLFSMLGQKRSFMNTTWRGLRAFLLISLMLAVMLAADYYLFPRSELYSRERVGFLITTSIAATGVYFFCWFLVGSLGSAISRSWFGRHETFSIILVFLLVVGGPFEMDSILQLAGFTGFAAKMLSRVGLMAALGLGSSLLSLFINKMRLHLTLAAVPSDVLQGELKTNRI
jgi:hypothetical protein